MGETALEGPSSPLRALSGSLSRNQAVASPRQPFPAALKYIRAQSAARCARKTGPQIKAYKQIKPKQTKSM